VLNDSWTHTNFHPFFLSLSLSPVAPSLEHRAFVKFFISLQFFNPKTAVELLRRGISSSQSRFLHRRKQTPNNRAQTSMLWVGFEPTFPEFERAKTVHFLVLVATVIGPFYIREQVSKATWCSLDKGHAALSWPINRTRLCNPAVLFCVYNTPPLKAMPIYFSPFYTAQPISVTSVLLLFLKESSSSMLTFT
jgi:hypothetical protein